MLHLGVGIDCGLFPFLAGAIPVSVGKLRAIRPSVVALSAVKTKIDESMVDLERSCGVPEPLARLCQFVLQSVGFVLL